MGADRIELEVGPAGITALRNALDRQLGRYKGTIAQHHAANAPPEHREDVEKRAAALSELARAAADPEFDDSGRPIVRLRPSHPDVLRDELARIYAEFGPESRSAVSSRSEEMDCEELAGLLAGWGHRA